VAYIKLHVDEKNLDTVLSIVKNLKEDLVKEVEVVYAKTATSQKPLQNKPPKPVNISSKYVDAQTFKERLKRMKNGK
jgi:hypothetical protein